MIERTRIAGFLHFRTDIGDGVRTGVVFSDCSESCGKICSPYRFLSEHDFSGDTLESMFYTEEELISYLLEERTLCYTKKLGISFLGKEPLREPFFCKNVGKAVKSAGMDLQIHTCGMCSETAFDLLEGTADLFVLRVFSLFSDPGNPLFHPRAERSKRVIEFLEKRGYPYRLLIPILPGATLAEAERISDYASSLRHLKSVITDFSPSGLSGERIVEYRNAFLEKRVILY